MGNCLGRSKRGGLSEDLYNDLYGVDLGGSDIDSAFQNFNSSITAGMDPPYQAPGQAGLSVETGEVGTVPRERHGSGLSPEPVQRGRRRSIETELEAIDVQPTTVDGWLRSVGMADYWPTLEDAGYDDLDTVRGRGVEGGGGRGGQRALTAGRGRRACAGL
jgi:hypothetical protein